MLMQDQQGEGEAPVYLDSVDSSTRPINTGIMSRHQVNMVGAVVACVLSERTMEGELRMTVEVNDHLQNRWVIQTALPTFPRLPQEGRPAAFTMELIPPEVARRADQLRAIDLDYGYASVAQTQTVQEALMPLIHALGDVQSSTTVFGQMNTAGEQEIPIISRTA